jgi:type VI secretion system protein VasJ
VYVTFGLFQTRGAAGLLVGLFVLEGLLRDHWPVLWPELKRLRGRAAAMSWLRDRLAVDLSNLPARGVDGPTCAELARAFGRLDEVLRDRFGDAAPSFASVQVLVAQRQTEASSDATPDLCRASVEPVPHARLGPQAAALRDVQALLAGRDAEPIRRVDPRSISPLPSIDAHLRAPPPSAPPLPSRAPLAPSSAPVAAAAADPLRAQLGPIVASLTSVAAGLRAKNPADPTAYRLARAALWLALSDAPPCEGTRSFVPAPAPRIAQALASLAERRQWRPLLEEVEAATLAHPWWLTPHRFAALALASLGYPDAALAVQTETRALLARLPSLRRMRFADGITPLADEPTCAWLDAPGAV